MPTNYNEYNKRTWINNNTKLNEDNMNQIENAVQENRENTIDLKDVLDKVVAAIRDHATILFNNSTKQLTLSLGDASDPSAIKSSSTTAIDLSTEALDKVTFFLNQVSIAYPIKDNIIDYCDAENEGTNKIYSNYKVNSAGGLEADALITSFYLLNVDNFKQFKDLPTKIYISTTAETPTPVYSIAFYSDTNMLLTNGWIQYPTGQVDIPSNTKYISISIYNTALENTRLGLTPAPVYETKDYTYYKLQPKYVLNYELLSELQNMVLHMTNTNNPHSVTKAQVGLDNVDNTSDADKPISNATQEQLLKAKYHLGAFDTVDTSNADYDLITRKTGYLHLEELSYSEETNYYYYTIDDLVQVMDRKAYCSKYSQVNVTAINNNEPNTFAMGTITPTTYGIYISKSSGNPSGLLQYETTTSYTEKVIKNQPINTLDVNGSEFLRDEWKKSSNLFDGLIEDGYIDVSNGQNASSSSYVRPQEYIPIDANKTYTLSKSGVPTLVVLFYTSSKTYISYTSGSNGITTFTTPSNCAYIRFYGDKSSSDTSIMLNEGDHAYPYQEFNGHIVHKKELETTKQELEQEIEEIVNEESVDVSDNILIKISGISDNLALPPESQMEVNDIEGNSVVVNQHCRPLNNSYWAGSNGASVSFSDGIVSLTPTQQYGRLQQYFNYIAGHRMLVMCDIKLSNATNSSDVSASIYGVDNVVSGQIQCQETTNWQTVKVIVYSSSADQSMNRFMVTDARTSDWGTVQIKNYVGIDLTQWFGSNDNIPTDILTTPSNFFKYYRGDFSYNVGQIRNANTNEIKSIGRNIWNEKWVNGYWDSIGFHSDSRFVGNKYLTEVIPNCQYYMVAPIRMDIMFYDINGNFISNNSLAANTTFTTPINCYYIGFANYTPNTMTTYNHDICINVSDPNFNGTYVAHVENTLDFGNDTLRSAGSVRGSVRDIKTPDGTITRKVGSVDLGSLTWSGSSGRYLTGELENLIKKPSSNSQLANIISTNYTNTTANDESGSGSSEMFVRTDGTLVINSATSPTGTLYYELATPTTEQGTPYDNHIPVYYGGEEFTTGDVPFVINKNYDISIKDQVITNVRVDKEQSEQIHALENADKSLQEQIDNIEEEFNESSVDTTDTKIIKVSGLDDNLAIPEESQVEINKVVCGALVDNNVIPTANKNGSITVPSDASYYDITIYNNLGLAITEGHVILAFAKITRTLSSNNFIGVCFWNNNNTIIPITLILNSNDNDGVVYNIKKIPTGSSVLKSISFNNYDGKRDFNTGDTMSYSDLNWCDLTIRYGSTIAEYLASLSLDNALAWLRANDPNIFKYREYGNALVNTNGDLITTNRNVWDEEWEKGGIASSGEFVPYDAIRSKNLIRVVGGKYYSFTIPNYSIFLFFYDINGNFISYQENAKTYNEFVVPNNAYYMAFQISGYYGTTYNHDICINISDTSFNGQYVSHKQETQTLPSGYGIPKLVDNKLSFDGDEIIGDKFDSKYDIVDLGTLNWSYYGSVFGVDLSSVGDKGLCTKYERVDTVAVEAQPDKTIQVRTGLVYIKDTSYTDAATFKAAMSGVMLVYEKAQPTQSTITPIHPMSCYKGGYELQNSDVPYTLTRNYDISIKDQVKTNVEVDREQSNAIKSLNQNVLALQDIIFTITNTAIDGYTNIGQITLDNDTLYIWKKD